MPNVPGVAPGAPDARGVLARLRRGSSTLRSRLRAPGPPAPADAAGERAAAERMAEWCRSAARGDWAAFEKRLAWDGLDAAAAARALGPGGAPADASPAWLATFRDAYGTTPAELAAAFDAAGPPRGDRACRPAEPLPFEELLLPLVVRARARLAERAGADAHALLGDGAHAALERALLERLTRICARALYGAFTVYRTVAPRPGLAAMLAPASSAALYASFTGAMRRGRLLDFFGEYSVAARLSATVAALWVDAVEEFLRRLHADLPSLAATFAGGGALGPVVEIDAGLSDPHDGGRAVLIPRFACGTRVVYKPRPIDLEADFGELVEWLNARSGPALALTRLQLLRRDTHGWIEFAAHAPCESPEGVARFYHRCGALLAVAYALNGTDFHLENLIARGEHPALIDMEALLAHRFDLTARLPGREVGAAAAARQALEDSVVRVHMLPSLKVGDDGTTVETGGLAGARGAAEPVEVCYWRDVNTDGMRLARRTIVARQDGRNLPELGGERVDASAYVADVAAGFAEAYRLLAAGRGALTAPDGIVARMRHRRVRFILRHTNLYATAI
ncbi:MAG TPA: type 2 lanthipeptide synthetase LanM, partial [Gemmatimonadaceae bacterium]|nr:type 2 lanthipeptide synthetase LanM [Gemmatimonadaceae bacterium]